MKRTLNAAENCTHVWTITRWVTNTVTIETCTKCGATTVNTG